MPSYLWFLLFMGPQELLRINWFQLILIVAEWCSNNVQPGSKRTSGIFYFWSTFHWKLHINCTTRDFVLTKACLSGSHFFGNATYPREVYCPVWFSKLNGGNISENSQMLPEHCHLQSSPICRFVRIWQMANTKQSRKPSKRLFRSSTRSQSSSR